MAFAVVLFVYRREIRADQELKMSGQGSTRATNEQYYIRKRFQDLYGVFRPGQRHNAILPWMILWHSY